MPMPMPAATVISTIPHSGAKPDQHRAGGAGEADMRQGVAGETSGRAAPGNSRPTPATSATTAAAAKALRMKSYSSMRPRMAVPVVCVPMPMPVPMGIPVGMRMSIVVPVFVMLHVVAART